MKKILSSLLLPLFIVPSVQSNPNQELLEAAKTGNIETLKTIFSNDISSDKQGLDCQTIDMATRFAFDSKQPDTIVSLLLTYNTIKGSTLTWACYVGNERAVKMLLEADAQNDVKNTIVNHCHIMRAKQQKHTAVAKMVKDHLVKKGYGYAGTINLDA